jgi:hypothetical protein
MQYFTNGGELQIHYIFFNARFKIMNEAELIDRLGGRGGWAVAPPVTAPGRHEAMSSNRYPQLVGQADPGIKLYHSLPNIWTPEKLKGDLMYGPYGQIWNSRGERVDRGQVTSLKIDSPAMMSVSRNSRVQLDLTANPNAKLDYVTWSVSDPSFAIVDKDGVVTVLNKMGMAVVTAREPGGGITHSIVLRIT